MGDFSRQVELTIDSGDVAERWAVIVLDRFVQAMEKYGVGREKRGRFSGIRDGALFRSFTKELQKSDGDVNAVIFKFLKYGRFVDMGVGKGVSVGERVLNRKFDQYKDYRGKRVGRLPRKAKPFYSKTWFREVKILAEFYQQKIRGNAIKTIESALSGNIELKL